MSITVKIKSGDAKLEWVTIDGEGKENLSGKLQYLANAVVAADAPIIEEITKFWADNKPKGFKKPAKSLGIYPHTVPTQEKDEDGKVIREEDGLMTLAFKTGTTYQDGTIKKIQIYNAKARKVELPEGVKIGNDSVGVVSGAMGLYVNKSKQGTIVDAGVTLYLDAIQIKKLVEFTQDAGFAADDSDEDGWSGEDDEFTGEDTAKADSPAKVRL